MLLESSRKAGQVAAAILSSPQLQPRKPTTTTTRTSTTSASSWTHTATTLFHPSSSSSSSIHTEPPPSHTPRSKPPLTTTDATTTIATPTDHSLLNRLERISNRHPTTTTTATTTRALLHTHDDDDKVEEEENENDTGATTTGQELLSSRTTTKTGGGVLGDPLEEQSTHTATHPSSIVSAPAKVALKSTAATTTTTTTTASSQPTLPPSSLRKQPRFAVTPGKEPTTASRILHDNNHSPPKDDQEDNNDAPVRATTTQGTSTTKTPRFAVSTSSGASPTQPPSSSSSNPKNPKQQGQEDEEGRALSYDETNNNNTSNIKVTTVDQVEPIVEQVHVDAACLENQAVVRLQPYHIHNHYYTQQQQQRQQDQDELQDPELYNDLVHTGGMVGTPSVIPTPIVLRSVSWSVPVLCYGAYVKLEYHPEPTADDATTTLSSTSFFADPSPPTMAIGVVEATHQVCLMTTTRGRGGSSSGSLESLGGGGKKTTKRSNSNSRKDQEWKLLWQVFRGDSTAHVMEVGSSVAKPQRTASVASNIRTPTCPIHSGDPIVLRHVATGGLLSFYSGEWRILTDSYQQEEEPPLPLSQQHMNTSNKVLMHPHQAMANHDKVPLNRLRDHNYIVPSMNEVFAFVLDSVPWTTAWLQGGPLACRKFLVKSYWRFPGRHAGNEQDMKRKDSSDPSEILVGVNQLCMEEQESIWGQECILLDELLGSFLGLEGTYLKTKVHDSTDSSIRGQRTKFVLDGGVEVAFDRGLRSMVDGLLPLANHFVLVEEFIAKRLYRFEYGTVMQALCACLDGMVQDYSSFITTMENNYRQSGFMSLRELQVQTQSWMETFGILEKVVFVAAKRKGGALINGLRKLLIHHYQGNELAERTLRTLLDEASKPFMAMLQKWLANGILDDPYHEFMVQYSPDAEWDGRYTMDQPNTLQHFFPTPVEAERVLSAGRYWNAVRACLDDETTLTTPTLNTQDAAFSLKYHVNGAQVASYIQSLYTSASQALVRLLLEECDLMGALQLLKRYFLLDQGDFFLNFLDVAEEELSRDPSKLRQSRIQHLLQVSVPIARNRMILEETKRISPLQQRLRLSQADLACRFAPDSLVDEMDRIHNDEPSTTPHRLVYAAAGQDHPTRTGVDLFLLELTQVPFPLSLILSESNLTNYRMLFRHLFFAKHVERKLVMVWQDHLSMKEFTSVRGPMGSTYLLRQRMLHCVQNLIYYMMFEVIEPNWLEMMGKISSASSIDKTVDEIMDDHCEFLDHTLEACLLTNRDFVLAFTRVMQTCLLFAKQMETFIEKVRLHQDRHQVALENLNRIQQNLHARGSGLEGSSVAGGEQRAERQRRVSVQTRRVEREVASPEFRRMIVHYETTFTKHLRTFMGVLIKSDDKYHTQKVNLCIRLDYNGYVTSSMGLLRRSR